MKFKRFLITGCETPKRRDSEVNRKLFLLGVFRQNNGRLPNKGEPLFHLIEELSELFKTQTRMTVSQKMLVRFRRIRNA